MKFKVGDKCRVKKLLGGDSMALGEWVRVGSIVVICRYEACGAWPYIVRGAGRNAKKWAEFKVQELELIKRKGQQC